MREGNWRVKFNAVIATSLSTVGYVWASEKKLTTQKETQKLDIYVLKFKKKNFWLLNTPCTLLQQQQGVSASMFYVPAWRESISTQTEKDKTKNG